MAAKPLVVRGNEFISPSDRGVTLRSRVIDGPAGTKDREVYVQLTWRDLAALLGEIPALSYGDTFPAAIKVIDHLRSQKEGQEGG